MANDFVPPQELTSITTEVPEPKSVLESASAKKVIVSTNHGDLTVHVEGNETKPRLKIITYHDVGLDYFSCFQGMLRHPDAAPLLKHACFYHITAPGQEKGAADLGASFPNMNQLADQIESVVEHFKIGTFYGIGAGAGANVLIRYGAKKINKCCGLLLISPLLPKPGWFEWSFQKGLEFQMTFQRTIPAFVVDSMISTYFCPHSQVENGDLVRVYKEHLSKNLNVPNFRRFMAAYTSRSNLLEEINRESFKPEILMMYGANSLHSDTIEEGIPAFNPAKFAHSKIWAAGDLVHEEHPADVIKSFTLFLNGRGIFLGN